MQRASTAFGELATPSRNRERSLRLPRTHLAGTEVGLSSLAWTLSHVVERTLARRPIPTPIPAGTTATIEFETRRTLVDTNFPLDGIGIDAALDRVASALFVHGLDLSHPRTVAHLQPPPLAVAVVADALASATNASLDTFDSGPSAIVLERWLIRELATVAGFGLRADGVMTPGGSMSNLLGLMLARDAAAHRLGIDARRSGVGAMGRPIVFCSELAHFSVQRAAAALGLGEDAVLAVRVDDSRRMRVDEVERKLRALAPDETVIAIVATAGTTDFGTVDPLGPLADLAAEHGIWLHVDAAYGFGTLFSDQLASRLRDIERADSITLDLHKLGWQPAATSVLLVSDAAAFSALEREVPYLNPSDDAELGYDGLLGRSLQTTRRPDAVKVVATVLAYGTRGLGNMVDACHELARHAERRITDEPALELVAGAELTTVVFRYLGSAAFADAQGATVEAARDQLNGAIRRNLLEGGLAVLGRTNARVAGRADEERVCLKFTLLNPSSTPDDLDSLVDAVVAAGVALERETRTSGAIGGRP